MKLNNKYYILRHGEALSNVRGVISSWPEKFKNPLTKYGKEMVMCATEILKEKNIDLIIASPLLRTKQTAQIVAKELNVPLKFDKRLREIGTGSFNGKSIKEWSARDVVPRGENYKEVMARAFDFLKDINKRYQGKNILIVSHKCPLYMLENKVKGFTLAEGLKRNSVEEAQIHKGQVKELN